jgi:hypothetical protein
VRFHLTHIVPDPRLHGLNGYLEVMETVRWGLEALGHQVSTARNAAVPGAINILFGAQLLSEAEVESLPADSIVYNLEQIGHVPPEKMWPNFISAARRLRVWDYSRSNLPVWRALHAACEPRLVPIGYAPTLTRIPKRDEEIDVLFYGLPSDLRLGVFADICKAGLRAVYACGLYGRERDELIARAKLVLNLNLYAGRIFEVVRVSYLLANSKAVVSNDHPGLDIEPDLRAAVELAPVEQIVASCIRLVGDDPARRALEQRGMRVMQNRDIRPILRTAL